MFELRMGREKMSRRVGGHAPHVNVGWQGGGRGFSNLVTPLHDIVLSIRWRGTERRTLEQIPSATRRLERWKLERTAGAALWTFF